MNCQSVKLSSGLRKSDVAVFPTGLMSSVDNLGLRKGMLSTIMMPINESTGPAIAGMS
jgi:hypothetical protein